MTTFTLLSTSSSSDTNAIINLIGFAEAAIDAKHTVNGVFFYQQGTQWANQLRILPGGETDPQKHLLDMAKLHHIPLKVCVTAANRQGVISEQDAEENDLPSHSLHPQFEQVGLGEFVELMEVADRVVQF